VAWEPGGIEHIVPAAGQRAGAIMKAFVMKPIRSVGSTGRPVRQPGPNGVSDQKLGDLVKPPLITF
jgi:hypothetical protein